MPRYKLQNGVEADDGDWEVEVDADERLSVVTYNEGGYGRQSVYLDEALRKLTDEQRKNLFHEFCTWCGGQDSNCVTRGDLLRVVEAVVRIDNPGQSMSVACKFCGSSDSFVGDNDEVTHRHAVDCAWVLARKLVERT